MIEKDIVNATHAKAYILLYFSIEQVSWLACWNENIQGQTKYVMLNAASRLKVILCQSHLQLNKSTNVNCNYCHLFGSFISSFSVHFATWCMEGSSVDFKEFTGKPVYANLWHIGHFQ